MGGGGDRMPFETLHCKDIKKPHVYHISSQTRGTHYKKRFQTLQTLLYLCIHRTLTLGIFLCTRPPYTQISRVSRICARRSIPGPTRRLWDPARSPAAPGGAALRPGASSECGLRNTSRRVTGATLVTTGASDCRPGPQVATAAGTGEKNPCQPLPREERGERGEERERGEGRGERREERGERGEEREGGERREGRGERGRTEEERERRERRREREQKIMFAGFVC